MKEQGNRRELVEVVETGHSMLVNARGMATEHCYAVLPQVSEVECLGRQHMIAHSRIGTTSCAEAEAAAL